MDKPPSQTPDNADDNDGAGPWNDHIVVPDSAELLNELLSSEPDAVTKSIIEIVTAMRCGVSRRTSNQIVDDLCQDPDIVDRLLMSLTVRACQIIGKICDDQNVSTVDFADYAHSIEWRVKHRG